MVLFVIVVVYNIIGSNILKVAKKLTINKRLKV